MRDVIRLLQDLRPMVAHAYDREYEQILREQIDETVSALRSLAGPDKGPWSAQRGSDHQWGVASEDFERDVWLHVRGDFADEKSREDYCRWLARVLNAAGTSRV